jgi:hypothetical protein
MKTPIRLLLGLALASPVGEEAQSAAVDAPTDGDDHAHHH